jgi:hypothetical protein
MFHELYIRKWIKPHQQQQSTNTSNYNTCVPSSLTLLVPHTITCIKTCIVDIQQIYKNVCSILFCWFQCSRKR